MRILISLRVQVSWNGAVCQSGRTSFLPDWHTRKSPTRSEIYQTMYWYNSILLMMSAGLLETCREVK
jgi:hypothetical protein